MTRHPAALRATVAASLLAAGALGAPSPASAQSLKLKMGIYDCYSYDYSTSSLSYSSSIKLIARGRYEHTFGRTGRRMVKATKGTYRVNGTRMTFTRGAMHRIAARVVKGSTPANPPKFNLLGKNGKAVGITCTYVTSRKVNP
jgi:hypothetical protein